ncbi:MAG: DUF624 domain-containing protein [Lachnospiraceae bacterium]|nr:DUF624 domain-containing protein [Lachnospiraceae bacterium]
MKFNLFDNPIIQAINKVTDYLILNLIWIICSLPIVTAGAALGAKYYVGTKMYRKEEPAVFSAFFYSFKKNLRQTLLPSLVIFLLMGVLAADWYFILNRESSKTVLGIFFLATLMFFMVAFCLFPLIARYEVGTGQAVKMAIGMSIAGFPKVFFAILMFFLPFLFIFLTVKWCWLICLIFQMVMIPTNSRFFVKVFDRLEDTSGQAQGEAGENFLESYGVSREDADKRAEEIFQTLFYGSEEERIYHPAGDDMGYMVDTGNMDARTEGMSYGMMMCVQMDKQEEFDRLWKWAKTYMYQTEGPQKGYFAWSCALDGTKNAQGAAPDGEEYFAMALIFAGNRWGNKDGIFNYHTEAKDLLHNMIWKGRADLPGRSMFDPDNHYIRFVAEEDFTDPSYHLPHFYEQFARYAYQEDRPFFEIAAKKSRKFWEACCHPDTGLSPEYANFDGTPYTVREPYGRHDWYYSDAYRTMMNMALDAIWCGKKEWPEENAKRFLRFFNEKLEEGTWDSVFTVDGKREDEKALHPYAVIASNATAAVFDPEGAKPWVEMFLEKGLRSGDRRYYDNCLHFFAYLMLSGNYRIYE